MGLGTTDVTSAGWLGLDLTPLRVSAQFRRYFTYRFVAQLTGTATYVAVVFQIQQLTNSFVQVALLGAVELIPIIVFGLWGGVIADHFDRRKVVIWTEVGFLIVISVLLINSRLAHPQVGVIYVTAACVAALGGIQGPSLQGIVQLVVPHELQREAAAISMTGSQTAQILGPSLGGIVAGAFGVSYVYGFDLISFSLVFALVIGLSLPARTASSERPDLESFKVGARYAGSRPDILGTYAIDLAAMFLAFPVTILPFMAHQFHNHFALGLLFSAMPCGALIASVTSKWTKRVHHYGRAIGAAATVWGLGIALFGWAPWLWLAFVGLAIGGAADAVSGIFRQAMWNESIPPDVRGRMAGIELISYSVGPTAGQLRAGVTAAAMGLRTSIIVSGLACSGVCAALSVSLRSLWDFDQRSDLHVAAVAAIRAEQNPPSP